MRGRKYNLWFDFCKTETEAKGLCIKINSNYTDYMRKHHKAHYTPWTSSDGKEHLFVVWSYR